MIDALVSAALVGTSRQPDPPRSTGSPIDCLVNAVSGRSAEQAMLLAAGAADLYRRAGMVPATCPAGPPLCPPEARPELGRRGAELLSDLLSGRQPLPSWSEFVAGNRAGLSPADLVALLPEAFRLVDAQGCRLPYALLPRALDLTSPQTRTNLLPVLGRRGRWLAALNPRWQWAAEPPSRGNDGPELAERLWQEGTAAQRRALLDQMRATAPDTARQWLVESWTSEKPESRLDLLACLETGLSAADQPFLEQALRDRAETVRERAVALLLLLPQSDLSARLIAVADTCLCHRMPAGRLQGLIRRLGEGRQRGTLDVRLPVGDAIDWIALGIGKPPRNGAELGHGAWYLAHVLSRVPPSHWSERFQAAPEDLIAAAEAGEWSQVLIDAWSEAAILHRDQTWLVLFLVRLAGGDGNDAARRLAGRLLTALPPAEADSQRARFFASGDATAIRIAAESRTGTGVDWGAAESRAFVEMVRVLPARIPESAAFAVDPWLAAVLQVLPWAARHLSSGSFSGVPRQWDLPDHLKASPWRHALSSFSDTVYLRRHIRQTLAAPSGRS